MLPWAGAIMESLRFKPMIRSVFTAATFYTLGVVSLAAQTPNLTFEKDVRPIFTKSCIGCHGAAMQMGDLDLRTPASILTGGKSKVPALVKGSAEKSLLYQKIADKSMPFGDTKLSDAEAQVIRGWIEGGAKSADAGNVADSKTDPSSHWAFQAPVRPAIPTVKKKAWVRTSVDAFILAELEKKGIRPPQPADSTTLARRAYFDLIGLPPTPEDRKAFLADKGPDAFAKLTKNLLARSEYGERWARHWLDVARYAESNGYERDGAKPQAWRYRDYVIDAFNKDKPYDRFLTEQIAGDEVEGSNAETQIATSFMRLGTFDDEPAEPLLDRYDQLDDVVGTTSAAFLGITLRCARCHDHKFDPYKQTDYYRFLAVFEPLKRPLDGQKELDRLVGTEAELNAYRLATSKADEQVTPLRRQLDELKRTLTKQFLAKKASAPVDTTWTDLAETVMAFQVPADQRSKEQKELVKKYEERLDKDIRTIATGEEVANLDGWTSQIAAINAARPKEPPRAYVWYEESPKPPVTHLLVRGDPTRHGDELQPGTPVVLGAALPEAPKSTSTTSGRRLWLAKWMTSPNNPLTARVIVNRLWQWHFGEGLVTTENDYGVVGQRPTNQALLDYLATELIQSGWSLKHIQRLIMESSTYRASAAWNEQAAKIDPDDTLHWRWKPRRLDAESVRDSLLAVSGQLNREMHGPSIYPDLPRAVLEGQSRPGEGWGKSDEKEASRRSVYIFAKRAIAVPELETLDAPDSTSSCEKRDVSLTGPQALTFLNGTFTNLQAHKLAERLESEAGHEVKAQLAKAFELVLSRTATAEELRAAAEFLAKQQQQIEADAKTASKSEPGAARRALEAFCLVMLNSNEFFYLN
jgi:hypothetical protein